MRKTSVFAAIATLSLTAGLGCSAGPDGSAEEVSQQTQDVTSCPASSAQDDQFRAVATLALTLTHDEAVLCLPPPTYTLPVMSVLAPQRYRLRSSGTGIEFDPNDSLYSSAVNSTMEAHLAIAQLDSTVAKFLSDGLSYAYKNTDGTVFPRMRMALALAYYHNPTPVAMTVYDSTTPVANSHAVKVSEQAWCNTSIVTLADTVQQSWQYSPLDAQPITAGIGGGSSARWYTTTPSVFKGSKSIPWTPFNGAVSTGNPYLVVTVNGTKTDWSKYNFSDVDCTKLANQVCSGSIELDPIPYSQPGAYYDVNNALVGPQGNPFTLVSTTLYADASHKGEWASRVVNGVQQWGTFSTAVTVLGTTVYQYTKQM